MFESFFTTKMSLDKKKLAGRFSKISSRTKRGTKIICVCIFALIVAAVVAISLFFVAKNNKPFMSENELSEYTKRPVGAVMAQLDYADEEKAVFHYLDGLFVYDVKKGEIIHAINLKKLNVGFDMQGDETLSVVVDEKGENAYLSTLGRAELIKDFDDYCIDLKSGKTVKIKGNKDYTAFSGFVDLSQGAKIGGWHSDKGVAVGEKIYCLTVRDNLIGSVEFVVCNKEHKAESASYIFKTEYQNTDDLKLEKIKLYLKNDSNVLWGDRNSFEVNKSGLSDVKSIFDKEFAEKISALSDGNYDMIFVPVVYEEKTEQYIFVYDNYSFEIAAYSKITGVQAAEAMELLMNGTGKEDENDSELYLLTKSYLEKEFKKVFSPYYDITALEISSWNENEDGNEAVFNYTMRHKNYNRDPDTVDYIIKAKETSPEQYQKLYDDYLSEKYGNFQFKVVRDGENILLYSNDSPTGISWHPVKISDYIIG